MAKNGGEAPKIIVDSDWKNQAQAEKQRLAEQEEASRQTAEAAGAGGLPPADFRTLVGTLASQALMYMGGVADKSGRAIFDPYYAQHMIDLLAVIEAKTKGNLAQDEADDLRSVMQELRARFVELMHMAMSQQAAAAKGAGTPPPPGMTT